MGLNKNPSSLSYYLKETGDRPRFLTITEKWSVPISFIKPLLP